MSSRIIVEVAEDGTLRIELTGVEREQLVNLFASTVFDGIALEETIGQVADRVHAAADACEGRCGETIPLEEPQP